MSTTDTTAIPTNSGNGNPLVQEIHLDKIKPPKANPRRRMDDAALAELAENIKTHGVLQPILVRPLPADGYQIVCGERRWRASKTAGKDTIPARIVNLTDAAALELAVIENLQRENVHELDEDLEQSLKFYRDGLGLPTKGIVGTEYEGGAVVFFNLKGGLTLALWPKKELAKDANITATPSSPAEFSIGHNVVSKEEVDEVMRQAEKAGAKITKPAQDTFWGGYAGYFQDLDGHLWEIAWNPHLPVEE